MTLLIRGPVESEIAVLSFRRSQASCAVPAAGGQERRPEPGRGQPGLRWASLALIFQEGQSQEPALPEVGRFEVFAYDGGRAGPGGVNEEGRLKRLRVKAELRGWGLALVQRGRRPLAAEPSPVASVLWLCRAEAAEARHSPRVLAVSSSRSPLVFSALLRAWEASPCGWNRVDATQGSVLVASVWEARSEWMGVWSGYLFCFLPARP